MPSKSEKFAQFKQFKNSFSYLYTDYLIENRNFNLYRKWHTQYFHNPYPIVIEIGCGRGEYTTRLAEKYPKKNFIGIDFKSNRMWKGAKYALDKQLSNVAFLRTRVEFLHKVFSPNEVDEIWITFPDPQVQKSREKKRLTHPSFLIIYKQFLKPNGWIHLKTDNDIFFNYTLEVLKTWKIKPYLCTFDLYNETSHPHLEEVKSIQTYYEQLFLEQGCSIKYCMFQINNVCE